ncbi:carbohydrate kinase [Bacillus thuringiensis serovar finitimus]|nr:gluconate kinase [Bacillus thuringiensis serovar finitimus YBT-020]OTX63304.1 carbohydrate kinase [Bacillus thuringiensis serovar finitimus]
MLWMKEEEPELYKSTYKFISIKEYGIYQLFSRYVVDDSIASATWLFNLETLNWDVDVLGILNIST